MTISLMNMHVISMSACSAHARAKVCPARVDVLVSNNAATATPSAKRNPQQNRNRLLIRESISGLISRGKVNKEPESPAIPGINREQAARNEMRVNKDSACLIKGPHLIKMLSTKPAVRIRKSAPTGLLLFIQFFLRFNTFECNADVSILPHPNTHTHKAHHHAWTANDNAWNPTVKMKCHSNATH